MALALSKQKENFFFLLQLVCGHVIAEIGGICGNWQCHCHKPFFFFSNQLPLFFFPPLFWQCHCHNCQKFIPSISAIPLPQTFFFPPIFGNGIATIAKKFFFSHHLVFLARTHTSSTHPSSRYGQKELQQYHCRKSKISLSYFLSFSLQLLLNFGNGIAAIHSLFSDC